MSGPNFNKFCMLYADKDVSPIALIQCVYDAVHDDALEALTSHSSRKFTAVLKSEEDARTLLCLEGFQCSGVFVKVEPVRGRIVFITVKGLIPSTPLELVHAQMAKIGKILYEEAERYSSAPKVKTGVFRFRVQVTDRIPDCIYCWGYRGNLFYPHMIRKCFRCGDTGHLVGSCTAERCFVCRGYGHDPSACPRRASVSGSQLTFADVLAGSLPVSAPIEKISVPDSLSDQSASHSASSEHSVVEALPSLPAPESAPLDLSNVSVSVDPVDDMDVLEGCSKRTHDSDGDGSDGGTVSENRHRSPRRNKSRKKTDGSTGFPSQIGSSLPVVSSDSVDGALSPSPMVLPEQVELVPDDILISESCDDDPVDHSLALPQVEGNSSPGTSGIVDLPDVSTPWYLRSPAASPVSVYPLPTVTKVEEEGVRLFDGTIQIYHPWASLSGLALGAWDTSGLSADDVCFLEQMSVQWNFTLH